MLKSNVDIGCLIQILSTTQIITPQLSYFFVSFSEHEITKKINNHQIFFFIPTVLFQNNMFYTSISQIIGYLYFMRHLIKKILKEAVGVPKGILESSETLYNEVLSELQNIPDELENETDFEIETDLFISDLNINDVFLTISFEEYDKLSEVEYYSMAVAQGTVFNNRVLKLEAQIVPGQVKMFINLAGPEGTTKKEIIELFERKSKEIISSLSHELGHSYNDYKKKYKSIKEVPSYAGIASTSFPFHSIHKFLHYVYFTHAIENLVRPIEVSSLMRSGNIDKEGFYDFLTNNETYKMLKKINNFSYEGMREELKRDSEVVKIFLKRIGVENVESLKNDDELVDELLRIVYVNLTNNTIVKVKEMMTSNQLEEIIGFIGKKEKIFYDMIDYFNKFEKNIKGFYLNEEKKMKKVSEKMMKKLSKLWSLAKEKNLSIKNWDLHHKINRTGEQFETELKFKGHSNRGNK